MGMKPFLLITSRGEEPVASDEYAAYLHLTGLDQEDLEWRRIEREPLGPVDLQRYSGIILAGSPYTVSEPSELKSAVELRAERELAHLLDEVVQHDMPFLGICYGIGTIGLHQGATVDRTYGEVTQAVTIDLSEAGKSDPLFRELPERFTGFVGHKEAISDVPDHFAVLASSATCPVQAFRVGRNVYATQFHPELDARTMSARVRAYSEHGYFNPLELDEILEEINSADVRASHLVLGRFVEEYARADATSPIEASQAAPSSA